MLTVRTTVMMALVVGDGVVANFQKDTAANFGADAKSDMLGWSYMWNPTESVGVASGYKPLFKGTKDDGKSVSCTRLEVLKVPLARQRTFNRRFLRHGRQSCSDKNRVPARTAVWLCGHGAALRRASIDHRIHLSPLYATMQGVYRAADCCSIACACACALTACVFTCCLRIYLLPACVLSACRLRAACVLRAACCVRAMTWRYFRTWHLLLICV